MIAVVVDLLDSFVCDIGVIQILVSFGAQRHFIVFKAIVDAVPIIWLWTLSDLKLILEIYHILARRLPRSIGQLQANDLPHPIGTEALDVVERVVVWPVVRLDVEPRIDRLIRNHALFVEVHQLPVLGLVHARAEPFDIVHKPTRTGRCPKTHNAAHLTHTKLKLLRLDLLSTLVYAGDVSRGPPDLGQRSDAAQGQYRIIDVFLLQNGILQIADHNILIARTFAHIGILLSF